jgi:transposase-like protein
MKKYQVFSKEFKLEAVRLLEEGKKPAADIARELGLRRNINQDVGSKTASHYTNQVSLDPMFLFS